MKWVAVREAIGLAWTSFVQTANPHAHQNEALEPQEIQKQALFESIDYHKSYPQMYVDHLRFRDKRHQPLLSVDVVAGGGGAGDDDSPPQEETSSAAHDDEVTQSITSTTWFTQKNARSAATAIVEEVTAYDASSRNSTLRWILHVIIALTVGLVASGVTYSVAFLEDWRRGTLNHIVVDRSSRSLGYFLGLLFWVGSATMMVAIGAVAVVLFEPAAGGSGIPDVIAYLNGVMKPKVVNFRTFVAKTVSCIFAVAGGLPVGVEAPLIHLGAIAGAGVTQGRSRTLGCQTRLFQAFRNNKDRRDFITAGAACGVSAAFGAPIGGLLFVMEEVSSFWDYSASGQVFLASMISFSTIAFINSMSENDHTIGRVTNAAAVLFEVNIRIPLNLASIVPSLILGALCGLLAVVFTKINLMTIRWRRRVLKPYQLRRLLEPIVIVAIFSFVMYVLALMPGCRETFGDVSNGTSYAPTLNGDGIELWRTENVSTLINLTCHAEGQYSPLATLNLGSGKQVIRHLFNRQSAGEFPAGFVFLYFVVYFAFACWSSGTFVSGGLVVPSLCMGAAFGRLFGLFLVHSFSTSGPLPNAYLATESWMDPGVFALIGAGAMLGGINRMTMSICVIMVELSGELHYLLPIMVAIVMSKAIADWLCEPLFHQMLHLDSVPYLPMHLPKEFEQLTAEDVMKADVVTLRVRETTTNILKALRNTTHHAFPVLGPEEDPWPAGRSGTAHPHSRRQQADDDEAMWAQVVEEDRHISPLLSREGSLLASALQRSQQSSPERPLLDEQPHPHVGSGKAPHRYKFIGVVTREDVQVFLSLPSLQHFNTEAANSGATTDSGQGSMNSSSCSVPTSGAGMESRKASGTAKETQQPASVGSRGGGYFRRLGLVMERIGSMSWVEWMSHQTSLFFVIGDKQWHQNWAKSNNAATAGLGAVDGQGAGHHAKVSSNPYFVDERQLPEVVDMSLIVNRSPWVIPPFFNLSMAYSTFRSMGLRHIVVVDGDDVKGMITRKDLLINTLRGKLCEMHDKMRSQAVEERARKAVEKAKHDQQHQRAMAPVAGLMSLSTALTTGVVPAVAKKETT